MLNDTAFLRNLLRWVLLPAFLVFNSVTMQAQTFTFTQDVDLYFGEMAITSNTSVSTTTLTRSGAISNSGNIFIISQGTPGEYTISDLTPFTSVNLSITLPIDSFASFPGTEQLTLSAVDMPSVVTANGLGEATFRIGGTIETSGNGGPYLNPGNYPFLIPLDVTY